MSIDIEKERELIEAAEAVIARWYTPKWKDEPHTATFITRLRAAVEQVNATQQAPAPAAPEGKALSAKHESVMRLAAKAIHNRGHEGDARLADSLLGVLADLKSAAPLPRQAAVQGEWISVADRLPAVGQHILAFRPTAHITEDPPICITFYSGQMKHDWQDVEHGFDCLCHPSHWMPIPAAPQSAPDQAKSAPTINGKEKA